MSIDLWSRIRGAFSSPRRNRRDQTMMDPQRPSRSKASRSKSTGTVRQDEDTHPAELAEVHKASKRDESSSAHSLLLDRELLENLVWRLNGELSRYEARFRHQAQQNDERSQEPPQSPTGFRSPVGFICSVPLGCGDAPDCAKAAPGWRRADPSTLGPLLTAYDDTITEKELIIEKYEFRLRELSADFQKVINENERLHDALEDLQKKNSHERKEMELASKDVECLHSENVALLSRLEDYKTKVEDLEEMLSNQKLNELQMSDDLSQQQEQMKTLAREYRTLQAKLDEAVTEIENRVPIQHHQSSINECKILLDELKINYDKDRKLLEDRLVTMTKEKVDADARARAAFSEAIHNDARAKALEKLLRKAESRSERLQTKLVAAESCRDSSVRELKQLMAVAEKLTADQENLVRMVAAKRYCCEEKVVDNPKCKTQNKNKS